MHAFHDTSLKVCRQYGIISTIVLGIGLGLLPGIQGMNRNKIIKSMNKKVKRKDLKVRERASSGL